MSNSLPLLNSCVIFIVLCSVLVGAYSLSVSPAKLNFNLALDEKKCESIKVSGGQEDIAVLVENLSNDSLEMTYPQIINAQKYLSFCVKGKRAGKFFGLLVLDPVDKNIAIGVKIFVNVKGADMTQDEKITGMTVFSNGEDIPKSPDYSLFIILESIFIFICLCSLLFILIIRRRRY